MMRNFDDDEVPGDEQPPEPEPTLGSGMSPTIAQERARLIAARMAGEATECACCDQRVANRKGKFPANAARTLIAVYKQHGREFVHFPTFIAEHFPSIAGQGGDAGPRAHWWGLIEGDGSIRPDGNPRSGYYRLTDLGERFVRGAALIPSHLITYNDEVVGFTDTMIDIETALGNNFIYDELIRRWER